MDIANLALATSLAQQCSVDEQIELVTHRLDTTLAQHPSVYWTKVSRPFGMNLLGEVVLDRVGRQRAKFAECAVVNGGNCTIANSINWVHYVHAAYHPTVRTGLLRRLKANYHRWRSVRWERRSLLASRIIICNSQLTANHVIQLVGCDPDRVRTVYYGIDSNQFFPLNATEKKAARIALGWDDDCPRIVFIGALADDRKGFDTVFSAWKSICQKPDWRGRLVVIGSGAAVPIWHQRAKDDGLADSIDFLGFRKDVPDLLRAADLLVAPTRYEAYGLGVHEAICCGLPVLVTRETGMGERFPKELDSLLLDTAESPALLVDKLRLWQAGLLCKDEAIQAFSKQLRNRSWQDMAIEFVATCEDRKI